jgi:DNA end-binding protein Ku
MLEIAEKIIDQQEGKFDPTTFKDRYEDAVRELIARKKKGQKPVEAPEPEASEGKVVDLMDALRRSLAGGTDGSKDRAKRFLASKAKSKTKARTKARKPRARKRAA